MMKGYKAFDLNMSCKGFQYEVGKEYSMPDNEIEICEKGFHFCLNPIDCLTYYNVTESIFCEVESFGKEIMNEKDSKVCTSKIRIVKKIELEEFVRLSIDFISKNNSKLVASGDSSNLAASGDSSKLAASGYGSKLYASGKYSKLAASGDCSKLAASGTYSHLVASGVGSKLAASSDCSNIAASGDSSKLYASGDDSNLVASGNRSKLSASGNRSNIVANGSYSKLVANGSYSKLVARGNDSIVCAIGKRSRAKGAIGTWITLAEYDEKDVIKLVKTEQIDGNVLKENTFYKLENGEFTALKD